MRESLVVHTARSEMKHENQSLTNYRRVGALYVGSERRRMKGGHRRPIRGAKAHMHAARRRGAGLDRDGEFDTWPAMAP